MATKSRLAGATNDKGNSGAITGDANAASPTQVPSKRSTWKKMLGIARAPQHDIARSELSDDGDEMLKARPEKWSLGVLNDRLTDEVPGSILLMSNTTRNEPLGLDNAPARTSASSLPSPFPTGSRPQSARSLSWRSRLGRNKEEKKRTKDGKIILEPQPDDSLNDPLNWPSWRRDVALVSLGFYCMLGGGMTPVLAAGFSNIAATYHVSIPRVALTTGLYMMGLGLGSVIASPTAILYGKRPVYLVGIVLFIISAIWCALSPNYPSLVIARIVQGLAVSPVECLPSATIAEIFYLHERAYRLGIYTLLLLSGKNLVPLVSAAILQSLDWRWIFWIVAIVVGFCLVLVFLFVPETFWDRTPRPRKAKTHPASRSNYSIQKPAEGEKGTNLPADPPTDLEKEAILNTTAASNAERSTIFQRRQQKKLHPTDFQHQSSGAFDPNYRADDLVVDNATSGERIMPPQIVVSATDVVGSQEDAVHPTHSHPGPSLSKPVSTHPYLNSTDKTAPQEEPPHIAAHQNISPPEAIREKGGDEYMRYQKAPSLLRVPSQWSTRSEAEHLSETSPLGVQRYTTALRNQPPKTYGQTLKPWNGRLSQDNWFRAAYRPLILFAYPAILWSTLVYSLSIGWLIVLSESVTTIFRNKDSYNFSALQAGLVYVSPFVGGVLGTAVAGKVSDMIVRYMSRRNGGVYEPEFRLVMGIPIMISTSIGLMGYGWSAEERDNFIVPTVFFGIISFGCSLGSTTAITFAVDSYRQYAGEALVTLNFSKNIFHGLAFSLFFNYWLDDEGPKRTFVAIGGIQVACLLTTIPMYIYGKRARMWTVRKNMMEKF